MKVKVYRNLNKRSDVFYSIKVGIEPIRHDTEVYLTDVKMKHANPDQLQQVRTRCRNVVNWLTGELQSFTPDLKDFRKLACDPKKHDYFCDAITGQRIDFADEVYLTKTGAYYKQLKEEEL